MSSSSAFVAPPDHHHHHHPLPPPPTEQLCYVHCQFCSTVLAVSVPCTSFFKTVTVRCGHCTNLLSVDMRAHLLATGNQLHLGNSFFSHQNLLDELRNSAPSNMLMNQPNNLNDELPKPPVANRRYAESGSPTLGSSRSWKSMEMEIQSSLEKLLDINDPMSRCAASASPTASVTQKLTGHRDILHEYTQMDDVISQAQATRATLGSQRALFGDVQGKVKQLGDRFPVIRGLIGAIKRKKSRDTLILSGVIAACTLFILIYWLSK